MKCDNSAATLILWWKCNQQVTPTGIDDTLRQPPPDWRELSVGTKY